MANKLFFRGFRLLARVGVLPQEKKQAQTIIIDVDFSVDVTKAAARDALVDTVDYVAVKDAIAEVVARQHYQLVETLANTLADDLVNIFSLSFLRLTLKKPDIFSDMDAVGVTVVRAVDAQHDGNN